MDAAGKDGIIEHVMTGMNPQGVEVWPFKQPSQEELDHDFLWRCAKVRAGARADRHLQPLVLRGGPRRPRASGAAREAAVPTRPAREGVLEDALRVDQRLRAPSRPRAARVVVKIFLHISKEEQRKRFLARLDDPEKRWKFALGDVRERAALGRVHEGLRGRARGDEHRRTRRGTSSPGTTSGSAARWSPTSSLKTMRGPEPPVPEDLAGEEPGALRGPPAARQKEKG